MDKKNKAKFTPGPWEIADKEELQDFESTLPFGIWDESRTKKVCDVSVIDHGRERVSANAHLIAAAPEMFEALEQALEAIIYYCNKLDIVYQDEEEFIKIEAAIAKARGES